jgi:hypothetical protein
MNERNYLNTNEVSERFGLSKSWLAMLRVYGGGPEYIKCGKRVIYDVTAFEAWLYSHRRKNTSEESQ